MGSYNGYDCDKLLAIIENKIEKAKLKKAYVRKMEVKNKEDFYIDSFSSTVIDDTTDDNLLIDERRDESQKFENFLTIYLSDYKKMSGNITLEDMLEFLPPKSNGYYKDLISRLILESIHDISSWTKYKNDNKENMSEEDLEFCNDFIDSENKKIVLLKQALVHEDDLTNGEEVVQNKLILVPTPGGNMRIIEDLQHISPEYYPDFLELIKSIQDQSFAYLKPIAYGLDSTIFEVKGFKVRVIFSKLSNNHFALISAFIKKTDTDKRYRANLFKQYDNFKNQESFLKSNLDNQDFIRENDLLVEEMFNLLGKRDIKKIKKGELNGIN